MKSDAFIEDLSLQYLNLKNICSELNGSEYVTSQIDYWQKGGWHDYTRILSHDSLDLRGLDVLDFGCKYGFFSPVLLALGAKSVYCVDADEAYLELGAKIFSSFSEKIKFSLTNCGYLSIPSNSVDFIFVNEVISHVNPCFLDTVYSEFARILRPSGKILIQDGNNGANLEVQVALPVLWNQWENGPDNTHTDRDFVNKCFLNRRKDIIKTEFPNTFTDEEVIFLAENTSGLWGQYFIETIREYQNSKRITLRPYRYGTVPTNPYLGGYVMERSFKPSKVILDLEEHGIKAKYLRPGLIKIVKKIIKDLLRGKKFDSVFDLSGHGYNHGFIIIGRKS